ncbi:hypothetical protein Hypma_008437 [Hypsizygus marmoreus]|uniref:Uncharacterized protein n=1 Tax=Hypsizygus marmoreus TaxID=39966 RepID=A0A369JQA0_HYPMA|nr:hypothetical protein Hypma_008437 [Hypsizygus marmoreus]
MPRKPSSNTEHDRKLFRMYSLEKYKQTHRGELREKARNRMARYRQNLASLPLEVQEEHRLKRLQATARYREKCLALGSPHLRYLFSHIYRNREYLKEWARDRRAGAYIEQHGYEAFCKNFKKCRHRPKANEP